MRTTNSTHRATHARRRRPDGPSTPPSNTRLRVREADAGLVVHHDPLMPLQARSGEIGRAPYIPDGSVAS